MHKLHSHAAADFLPKTDSKSVLLLFRDKNLKTYLTATILTQTNAICNINRLENFSQIMYTFTVKRTIWRPERWRNTHTQGRCKRDRALPNK